MQTKLLTIKEVAARLKVKFIEPVRIGRLLQFKESDLNRWLAEGAAY